MSTDGQHGVESGKFKQYWQRQLLYNGPMLMDQIYQPFRFGILYLISHYTTPPLIQWLKKMSKTNETDRNQDSSPMHTLILQPLSDLIMLSSHLAFKHLCPSLLKPHIVDPFQWTPYHFTISNVVIASMGVSVAYFRSYFYFRNKVKDCEKWPFVYDYMMNGDFSQIIKESLEQYPLSDDFHIELTLKLYPVIKYKYFESPSGSKSASHSSRSSLSNTTMSALSELNIMRSDPQFPLSPSPKPQRSSSSVYELKIVQFTAANVAWYLLHFLLLFESLKFPENGFDEKVFDEMGQSEHPTSTAPNGGSAPL